MPPAKNTELVYLPLNYAKYLFKITICSAQSVTKYNDELFCWENTIRFSTGKDANIIIHVKYLTGIYSKMIGSKLFMPFDGELNISDPDSDSLSDIPCIVEVKI